MSDKCAFIFNGIIEGKSHPGRFRGSLNVHYDSRCFLPVRIYEATTAKPVTMMLRPARPRPGRGGAGAAPM
jgi:hypothetical protein